MTPDAATKNGAPSAESAREEDRPDSTFPGRDRGRTQWHPGPVPWKGKREDALRPWPCSKGLVCGLKLGH